MKTVKERVSLSTPHMSGKELQYLRDAYDSNWITPLGPQVDTFEKELASYLKVNCVLATISGTAALHLALVLLDVKKDDLVFCSSLTFAATANPILYAQAKPVFIDSEPATWNMSPTALGKAFKEAEQRGCMPKAVIVVNIFGQSADYEAINNICERYKVPVIEDAAESLGATCKGKMSGNLGKIGVISFNGNKIITTSGGGALVSDTPELISRARYLATQARLPVRHYEHSELGYNYRLSNILAAIGRGQLEVLEERVEARRAVFNRYYEALSDIESLSFMPETGFGRSTRWLTTLTVDPMVSGISRDQVIDALESENIESRPVWKPMHLQPLYKDCLYYPHFTDDNGDSHNPSSVSDRLFEFGLCLPSSSNLSPGDQERVISCIRQLF